MTCVPPTARKAAKASVAIRQRCLKEAWETISARNPLKAMRRRVAYRFSMDPEAFYVFPISLPATSCFRENTHGAIVT